MCIVAQSTAREVIGKGGKEGKVVYCHAKKKCATGGRGLVCVEIVEKGGAAITAATYGE